MSELRRWIICGLFLASAPSHCFSQARGDENSTGRSSMGGLRTPRSEHDRGAVGASIRAPRASSIGLATHPLTVPVGESERRLQPVRSMPALRQPKEPTSRTTTKASANKGGAREMARKEAEHPIAGAARGGAVDSAKSAASKGTAAPSRKISAPPLDGVRQVKHEEAPTASAPRASGTAKKDIKAQPAKWTVQEAKGFQSRLPKPNPRLAMGAEHGSDALRSATFRSQERLDIRGRSESGLSQMGRQPTPISPRSWSTYRDEGTEPLTKGKITHAPRPPLTYESVPVPAQPGGATVTPGRSQPWKPVSRPTHADSSARSNRGNE